MEKLSARQLFDAVGERLALRWVAGMRGENRAARTRRHAGAAALAGRLSQHHLSEQGADHRHRGAQLPRRAGFAPALGDDPEDHRLPAGGAAGHQGPDHPGRPAPGGRGIAHAAVDQPQTRPRTADLPAIPPRAHAGAPSHPARRAHGGLFDRRADHRRERHRQERAGAGTDHAAATAWSPTTRPNSP